MDLLFMVMLPILKYVTACDAEQGPSFSDSSTLTIHEQVIGGEFSINYKVQVYYLQTLCQWWLNLHA